MAGAEDKDKLDVELCIQNEKLRKIKEHNDMFDSLDAAKKELCDLENQWFFQRTYSTFENSTLHYLLLSVMVSF